MSLGVCCQWMEPKTLRNGGVKWVNGLQERNLQYGAFLAGKYSNEDIVEVYLNNLDNIRHKLPHIVSTGVRSFRISSNILPLIDRVPDEVRYDPRVLNSLGELGKVILENKMRWSVHPDQWCLLTSKKPEVVENSLEILNHHAWIFDQLGLPQTNYYAINIHGGVKGEFSQLVDSINKLAPNVRSRLTLENEELAYNVEDLYRVYNETGISITFDSHHHKFNPGNLLGFEAMELAISTWKEKPLTHLSNTIPGLETAKFQDRRKHSDYVDYIPEYQFQANNKGLIDIDFEFKMKNEAVFKAVSDFGVIL